MEDTSSKQHSVEPPTSTRKRKRKTYSCVDCRRRKLKCSRSHPCDRCVKEGNADSCTFRDDGQHSETEEYDKTYQAYPVLEIEKPGKLITNGKTPIALTNGSMLADQNVNLRKRIALLEAKLARFEDADHGLDAYASETTRTPDIETRFFKGTSFKTQFYGPTNPTSLFAHYTEIFDLLKQKQIRESPLANVQKDAMVLRARRKARKKQETPQVFDDLISLLPADDSMEDMVKLYFDTYETVYRIIHRPSFWTEYRASPPTQWRKPFVALVLTILASVSCVAVSKLNFKDDFSSARVAAQTWVSAIDDWSASQSQKHLTVETFQVEMLLLLAKANNALKRKRAWANSGFLLRIAVSAGFHREPSGLSGKITAFDEEMRRRLWASIFEWDLAASLSRGVPAMAASIPSDTQSPLNINDVEIEKDSERLPESRPISQRTDTSFSQISLQSISLRISLTSLLNDPNIEMSWSDVLSYEEKIQQEIRNLPPWARDRTTFDAVLLHLQLYQFILLLHAKPARGEPGPRTAYSRMACVNTSSDIVKMYLKLDDADINALNMLRYDMYQCIVTMSLTLLAEAKNASIAWSLLDTVQPICEKGFVLLEDKVLKVGEGYNHMWFAAAAFATALTTLDPNKGEATNVAVERVAKIYHKVLAYQEPVPELAAGSLPSTNGNSDGTGALNEASWQPAQSMTASAGSVATPAAYMDLLKNPAGDLLDFTEFPGWTDDFFGFDTSML